MLDLSICDALALSAKEMQRKKVYGDIKKKVLCFFKTKSVTSLNVLNI